MSSLPNILTSASLAGTSHKKVLFVSHEASRTGAPMFLLHFLRWLRANTSVSFELLLSKGGPLEPEFAKLVPLRTPAEFLHDVRALQSFDLIYANTCCNGTMLEQLAYGHVPIITHVHELDYGFEMVGARQWAEVIRQSHRYVACCRAVADRLQQKFCLPADRISLHYEMIDPARLATAAPSIQAAGLRRQFGIPEDALTVTACGTCDLRKGADLFAPLIATLRQRWQGDRPLHGLWIGKSSDRNMQAILTQDIRRLGLQHHLTFTGELADPQGLLATSDVFCLMSREDPFPLAMLEAAALAKPVVCFAGSGGAGEFAAFGGGSAVPYLDIPAMVETCLGLLRDPARRAEMGRRGAESVRIHFTVDAIAPGLWREIEGFLRSPSAPFAARMRDQGTADIYRTWNLAEAPEREEVNLLLERHDVFMRARARAAEGKPGEAIGLLLGVVRTTIAANRPVALIEALAEVSEELAAIDPAKARQLLMQAESMAAKSGARIEFRPAGTNARGPRRARVLAVKSSDPSIAAIAA